MADLYLQKGFISPASISSLAIIVRTPDMVVVAVWRGNNNLVCLLENCFHNKRLDAEGNRDAGQF